MSKPFKPLLAATMDPEKLYEVRFPVAVSPKLDGQRAVVRNGVVLGKSLKPIPNMHVQRLFGHLEGMDGELIVGPPTGHDVFQRTSGPLRRREGEPDVTFWVFDYAGIPDRSYYDRLEALTHLIHYGAYDARGMLRKVQTVWCDTALSLLEAEQEFLEAGYEGLMGRDPHGIYKFGRSTMKEGILWKLKRFAQDEGRVVGFEERLHNENEAKTNALGHTERSSHKEGMRPAGTLGKFIVEVLTGPFAGATTAVGRGNFTDAECLEVWNNQAAYLGRTITFKHFPKGADKAPRFPTAVWWREEFDMGGDQ